ncbi:up-regulator of cell proliferation [Anguilla anguilla]|uniref:up-regulator of cell proliferation n=1 Tax=Anguilla anguilla TaxID=7936 RepID=UPI0015ABE9B4|nr:up-regulator of cell proliferation [Anguilla anguilla]XP_035240279.1 up-regulator of cell proliferation [Anguilla anguilla]
MSFKHLSLSRKTRTFSAEERGLEDVLQLLGLDSQRSEPLDLAAMLKINTWNLEDPPAQGPSDLPHTFLHRLWLLSPQARSTRCLTQADPFPEALGNGDLPGLGKDTQCAVNPLDLVTAVYMSASSFLRQEMTVRMAQCGFAVPLLLPPSAQGGQVTLLLWSLRPVVRKWRPQSLSEPGSFIKGDITSANMPLLSFVRLGRCSVSKSQVVNHILGGFQGPTSCFLHRDMDGGQLPRRLSDGLVEVSWYLPSGDRDLDIFREPVMVANLRGDAATSTGAFKAQLHFLCRNSSVLFVFCESLGAAERLLLASFRESGSRVFLIMCSQGEGEKGKEEEEQGRKDMALKKLAEGLELPEGAVFSYSTQDSKEVLASTLSGAASRLLRDSLRSMTLVKAAATAHELSITIDEGEACRMALTQVEEVLEGLEQLGASRYMDEQLPLQGQLWKRLAQLEKEDCRLKDSVKSAQRQQETKTEMERLCQQKRAYRRTAAMRSFIAALSTPDKLKRAFFLSWMRLRLNAIAWQRQPITKKQEATTAEGTEEIQENSEKISNQMMKQPEPFLGLKHFTREMGLIFEMSILSPGSGSDGVLSFPALATDLLLYGLPLELLDGDASTMPPQLIGSVLSVVQSRLPQGSRVRVLTVLGLHTSSNAAVISALLGVTFPVGDKQNVRGAFMLLLAVPENLRKDLACNFLLLINTEGLKCLGMDQEEDTEMRNNELATFAMGLSDVTLLNLPTQGEAEMWDTLRIMVNALLRVKETGRMPFFQAVAQGSGVDTKQLLQLLSRVTQIMAAGDKNLIESSFDNLQEYEVTSSKLCLQGPWQNSHPMAPVSPEYSKAVMDHKQTLLTTLRKCAAYTPSISLLDFMEHVTSLWETVLFEKFPFEMKNTGVGEAFCDLCREFSHWEHTFLGHMDPWVEGAVELIRTFEENTPVNEEPNGHQSLEEVLSSLKIQAVKEVESEASKVISNLEEYFKKGKGHSSLIETYRDNFTNSVYMLKEHTACEASYKLEAAKREHDIATKTKHFQTELEAALEVRLGLILERYKASDPIPEDKQLQEEFDQVWDESISKLDLTPLATRDIASQVLQQLRENLANRGISKHLDKLTEMASYEASAFTVDEEHFGYRSRLKQMFTYEHKMQAQELADRVIEKCRRYTLRKKSLNRDYLDSYTRELLKIVDKALETKQFDIRSRFEVELKVHVCASAARSFQEMHENFTKESDPLAHLERARDQNFWKFVYDFRKRDQCRKAARTFITLCLKPAVLDYIYRALGKLILEDMLSSDDGHHYQSPQAFHFNLLKELLQEDSFESFLEYLLSSESFIRRRIQDHIKEFLSGTEMLQGWMQQHLELISERMLTTVRQIGGCWNESWRNVRLLLERVCDDLEGPGDVAIPRDALQGPLFQITMPGDRFIECLEKSLTEMLQAVNQEFLQGGGCSTENIASKLQALPVHPLDELYRRVRGCEERCPFCKAPCEAWERDHTVHRALLHRPKGLVSYACAASDSLSHNICPSDIVGENQFCNRDTAGQFLHYRDYQSVYPNWSIPEEAPSTRGQSVYWKYVLVRHNSRFAQEYQCEPAQLPEEWLTITQEEAIQSLRETFGIL